MKHCTPSSYALATQETTFLKGKMRPWLVTAFLMIPWQFVCLVDAGEDPRIKSVRVSAPLTTLNTTRIRTISNEVAARIDALIEKMTLEEKLGQLTQQWGGEIQDMNPVIKETKQDELFAVVRAGQAGSFLGAHGANYTNALQRAAVENSRLGIPLILGNDVIHGYRTLMPVPLAEASSWSPEIAELSARVAATEARAAGTHWTFAPMVDICRDPRWGRIAEGAGEDPLLGAVMAAARVRGFQGTDLKSRDSLLACVKHYAAYGAPEGGRDYNTVNLSERAIREVHLPPFEAAVRAGCGSLMTAFNEINGIPATAHPLLLKRILRGEWGFEGFVVSDWDSIGELVDHGYAANAAHAARLAISHGVDMDMSSFVYSKHLAGQVGSGQVAEAQIDTAVRRVLQAKFALGLFDSPYADPELEKTVTLSAEHRQAARTVARHSIVLLKNDNDTLPLKREKRKLAVIGPLADSTKDPLGTWAAIGKAEDVVSALRGIRDRAGDAFEIGYAKACAVDGDDRSGFAEAVALARSSDAVLLFLGERENMSGEGHCRAWLDFPGVQRELAQAVHATGKPTTAVVLSGRPMSIPWIAENLPAVVYAWHLGVESGNAIADVLFGDFNPSGRLPATFPRTVGQVPMYYAHKNTGRPPTDYRYTSKYIDVAWTPLYPFGYGLTYTQFEYTNLQVSSERMGVDGNLEVSVELYNSGSRKGTEVVQLYVRDLVASVTRPVRELKNFTRVELAPGERRRVVFTLSASELAFYDQNMKHVVEPGKFQVWIAPHAHAGVEGSFEVVAE